MQTKMRNTTVEEKPDSEDHNDLLAENGVSINSDDDNSQYENLAVDSRNCDIVITAQVSADPPVKEDSTNEVEVLNNMENDENTAEVSGHIGNPA